MLDTGAAVCVTDLEIVKHIGLHKSIMETKSNLVDASGNAMPIIGAVDIPITVSPRLPTVRQRFYVLDSQSNSNVLLGRDFMQKFGTVSFNFNSRKVRLGTKWITCLHINSRQRVKLCANTVIKARSEQVISVKCNSKLALLSGDFEPTRLNRHGLYMSRARVIANVDGIFQITIMNVHEKDIALSNKTFLGFLHPNSISVARVDQTESQGVSVLDTADIQFGEHLSDDEKDVIRTLLHKYDKVFATNPQKPPLNTISKHRIITNDALPIKIKPRRLPFAWINDINSQIQDMIENEIIRPSKSPWNCPVILVKKKDNSNRFVCDFRALNNVTKKDSYPLPHIKDVIDQMQGAKFWTTLDAAAAYWSIPLAEEDKEKTAFSVLRGKYEFNVTPYGLSNAGATYQRMIDICLSGLPPDRVLAYMDDIVIFSKTFDEHKLMLEKVFQCLLKAGVTLKISKCNFANNVVDFLGYELSEKGVKPQKRLTEAIRTFSTPQNRKEVRRFLGLAGFYRRFIPDFANISRPLNALSSDNVLFEWTNDCELAFNSLKDKLSSEPVL